MEMGYSHFVSTLYNL